MGLLNSERFRGNVELEKCVAPGGHSYGVSAVGPEVILIQIALKDVGYLKIAATGTFGPETEAAVKILQKFHNVPRTGVVGSATLIALDQDLLAGDPPPPVPKGAPIACPPPLSRQVIVPGHAFSGPEGLAEWSGLIRCVEKDPEFATALIPDRIKWLRSHNYGDAAFTRLLGPSPLTVRNPSFLATTLISTFLSPAVVTQARTVSGSEPFDMGHLFAGLDAMTHPSRTMDPANLGFGTASILARDATDTIKMLPSVRPVSIYREDFATWLGDVAQAAGEVLAMHVRDRSNMSPADMTVADLNFPSVTALTRMEDQFTIRGGASPADLEGDIMPYVIREKVRPKGYSAEQARDHPLDLVMAGSVADILDGFTKLTVDRKLVFAGTIGVVTAGKVDRAKFSAYADQIEVGATLLAYKSLKLSRSGMPTLAKSVTIKAASLAIDKFVRWLNA